jgi:hypothetical protein
MKTIAPLSTVAVPRSPERLVVIARNTTCSVVREEVVRGDFGEVVRVERGGACTRRWVLHVPKGVVATITLEVVVERGGVFAGEVEVSGGGVCTVRRILRVVGARGTAHWLLRGQLGGTARFSEESWAFVSGTRQELSLRTRLVLLEEAHFAGRHFVTSGSLGAAGVVTSALDVLRQSPLTVATVVPEVGVVPPGLLVNHGARVMGVAEAQEVYLRAHGMLPAAAEQTLVQAFLYA